MGKQVVASLGTNKGSTQVLAFAWTDVDEKDLGKLGEADLSRNGAPTLKPSQYARFLIAVPKGLEKDLGEPIKAELALYETDAGEKKKSGTNDKAGKALIATYAGTVELKDGRGIFQIGKADVPDLAAHLKDGTPSFRWAPDDKRYFVVPLHESRVGSKADEKGNDADPTYEIVFEFKVGAKLDKVKIDKPSPVKAVSSSARSGVMVVLDLPFANDDVFILESNSGTTVKKTHADGIAVGDKHLAISFDNIKLKGTYSLTQQRGKAKTVLIDKWPGDRLVTAGERMPDFLPQQYFIIVDAVPKPTDGELAGTPPDFGAIKVAEPRTE